MNAWLKKAIIVILLALPPAMAFFFVARYGVNVVFQDQWEMVPLFDKLYSGHLSFADLMAQHNEHRFLVVRLITLGLGSITHWNTVAEMFFSWVLLCLICFVLYRIFSLSSRPGWSSLAWFIPVPWLMFNLLQFENLLFGIQMVFYAAILCFVLTVYLLQTSRGLDWRFCLAALCSAVGTYSVANGLLIWIIGLFQLLCMWIGADAAGRKRFVGSLAVWSGVAVVIYVLFFWNYQPLASNSSPLYFVQQPLATLAYGLAAVGSQFGFNIIYVGIAAGSLLVVLYFWLAVMVLKDLKTTSSQLPALTMIVFALGFVGLLMLGRAGLGTEQALSSRYISFTVLGVIGLYIGAALLAQKFTGIRSVAFRAAMCLLLVFLLSVDLYFLIVPGKTYLVRQLARQYLITYQSQSDANLRVLFPKPDVVRQYGPILQKYRLNVFHESP